MPTRWSPTPAGVRARTPGPSRAASLAAALLTIAGTTLAFLIAAAIVLPGPYGLDGMSLAVASSSPAPASGRPAPVATPIATPATAPATPAASGAANAVPSPAVVPTTSPAATAGASAPAGPTPTAVPALAEIRQPAPLTVGGREIAEVTVQGIKEAKDPSTELPDGRRLMVASIRLDARGSQLPYDELHWRLEDENGDRWEPVAAAAPRPLGSGTVGPEARVTGGVAFAIPTGVRVKAVILTDGSGADLLVFARPAVSG